MKTNKLPKSAWPDSQEAGSQSSQASQSSRYYKKDNSAQTSYASNDSSYNHASSNDDYPHPLAENASKKSGQDGYFGYKSAKQTKDPIVTDRGSMTNNKISGDFEMLNNYKQPQKLSKKEPLMSKFVEEQESTLTEELGQETDLLSSKITSYKEIPERVFMNGLIKHTGIALAIIIPLAAFSAYAATPPMNNTPKANVVADTMATENISIKPDAIIHKSASTPTTVNSVDLKKYAGTWYEIGRLPMYFQRKCAGDVTANYTEKTDGSGIVVTNKCMSEDGSEITAEGLAKPADDTGSKLKVTFLPSWIRWLPVGRADYWVLARDPDYKTALVGTPDKDYLWLLARSPNISQETYAKYRQIAQQQGYDLKEFKLTPQTNQTTRLVP
ncbi:lipocalin family protein [Psychrobacter alimentarius]|uniref:lipocalin family protein n=1 Tax=Psychrobacter alimentarius TaxID=261164 RepID=UPI003FD467FF